MRQPRLTLRPRRSLSVPRMALAAAIGTIVSYPNLALAQERDASLVLEEIIVSAQKELENIQDIPSTVNAVNADNIKENKIFSIDDLGSITAGVSFDRPDARRQTITLRGITSDPDNVAAAPISTYFDEQPVRTQEAFQALYDIALIEILRGPQGTLQGRTDPAGALHIYSQKPNTSQIDGYVEQSLSDNSGSNTQFGVSLPIIPEVLAVRLAGVYDENEGQEITNITSGQNEQHRNKAGRMVINWIPTDSIEATLNYNYNEAFDGVPQTVDGDAGGLITGMAIAAGGSSALYDGNGGTIPGLGLVQAIQANPLATIGAGATAPNPPYALPGNPTYQSALFTTAFSKDAKIPVHLAGISLKEGDRKAIHEGINDSKIRNEFANLHLDFDLGDYTLSSITGYKELNSDSFLDRDDGYVYRGLPQMQRTRSLLRFKTQELRLAYTEGDFWEYQVGMFYEESETLTTNSVDATGGFDLTGAIAGLEAGDAVNFLTIPIKRKNTSFFMHNKFNFSEQTTLQVGLRWQKAEIDTKATSTPINTYTPPGTDVPVFDPTNGGTGTWASCGGDPVCNGTNAGILAGLNGALTDQGKFNAFFSSLVNAELIPAELQQSTDRAITGGIKLQHYLDADSHETMLYASVDRSFRPSGVTVSPSPLTADNLLFEDESSDSLEIGFKSTLMGGSLRVNGSTYIQKYDGYQARADVVNFINNAGNTEEVQGGITFNADATITGAELEFQKVLTSQWSIGGGMAYVDGTFDDGATGPCNGTVLPGDQVATCDISGLQVSSQPLWSGTFNTEYFIPMEVLQGSEWYVRGVLSYKGTQTNRLVDDLAIADYTVINLYTGLRSSNGSWDLSFWAKNAADTERRADLKNVYEVSFGQTNFRRSTMIAPRLVGMTFRYTFGNL